MKHSRALASTCTCLLLLAACGRAPEEAGFRHIVLLGIDGLRGDHLGSRGYPRAVSPFLDELAGRSVDFERAYAGSPRLLTSYASMFTSLHASEHGLVGFEGRPLDEAATTLAEVLGRRGFQTAAFLATRGDWARTGFARGFAHVDVPSEVYAEPCRPAAELVDRALEWLAQLDPDVRVFVFIQFADVEGQRQAPPEHFAGLGREKPDEMVEFALEQHHVPFGFFHYENKLLLRAFNSYDVEIRYVDAEIARMYRDLGAMGWGDGTLWVVTSPYGWGLGNHLLHRAARHVYEAQVRVPLWIHAPGGEFDALGVQEVVGQIDLAPTLLELAGGEAPEPSWRGRSLVPLLAGDALAPRAVLVQRGPAGVSKTEVGEPWRSDADLAAIVEQRWKLIRDSSGAEELYDVTEDPFELDERSGSAAQPEIERLRRLLADRLAEINQGPGG
ncbi:MAG: sulfatase-like hydrolase/transferase [Myxococcota bacterium]|nr:sulfatase-like hydrolase/transferase [bacterium]MDP6076443.1 sulfatase-like hydrolase/transferase [Myxococcota bacterium]MDP6244517.1 sulfatase-like hydrolase/transferase [Myxococcota bacterium]MDP7073331.1 sulfatase-like hydrolase/transferase [Myxococcota bacterium]MDP7301210.1 sulfatase-like hydrolase/transferase [Myxococcota bacterium]